MSDLSDLRWRKWGYGANVGRYDYLQTTQSYMQGKYAVLRVGEETKYTDCTLNIENEICKKDL